MITSILRQPDKVTGATENRVYRFEEKTGVCDVKFQYKVGKDSAKVIVYPSGKPVRYLKLRFHGDFSGVDKVYADDWARCSCVHPLTWKTIIPERVMPWFCYLIKEGVTYCYGVKTQPDCFVSWQIDSRGISLFLDLSNGSGGTDLQQPITACEVIELQGEKGEDVYTVAKRFAKNMCENPVLPSQPIFGVNNWYWAYGNISAKSVLAETDYLLKMTDGVKNKPYMIIDDGWQKHRTVGAEGGDYIGGEWTPNDKFGDMKALCDKIHAKGAKAGLWFRPLLTREQVSEEEILTYGAKGTILDPSHEKVLKRVENDARTIRSWGFDLIKHDFTQIDIFGSFNDDCYVNDDKNLYPKKREFYDKTKTNATIIKNLYKAIARGAGNADVIGCNTFGHLCAGIHSINRTGCDTSGRNYEITRSHGVNSMMRLPLNKTFYMADPDCAAFTELVDFESNFEFLEMCAVTGVTTLASVTPNAFNDEQLKRINQIFRLADANEEEYAIKDYDKTSCPDTFVSSSGKVKTFDWYKHYDGVRIKFDWLETVKELN